jgi:hypothetical protein
MVLCVFADGCGIVGGGGGEGAAVCVRDCLADYLVNDAADRLCRRYCLWYRGWWWR